MKRDYDPHPKSLTQQQKLAIVLERNTFFFNNKAFEEKWEAYVGSVANLLVLLQRELKSKESIEDKKQIVIDILLNKPDGLTAVLALTSISEEFLLRLITFTRTMDDEYLNKLVKKDSFAQIPLERECSKTNLYKLVKEKREVAESIVNLLFEGFSVPILQQYLPLFELKKLSFSKLEFSVESLIDSIVRQSKRGSYKAQADNDPAGLLKELLEKHNITYVQNTKIPGISRKLDFVIPNVDKPQIIIESSYEITTSSAMGDKAKTEIHVAGDINTHFSGTAFVGFVDGVGWYVRRKDLERLISAFDMVFTFKPSELTRFLEYAVSIIKSGSGK